MTQQNQPARPAQPSRAIPSPAQPARPVRDRVVAVLLALAAILVAGVIVQVSNAVREADGRIYVDVDLNQRARLTEHASGAVVDVRVGDRLRRRDELAGTGGRWVVVDLRTWAGIEKVPSIDVELHWNGNTYLPADEEYETTPPGFTSIRSVVFEVPAEATRAFTLEVGHGAIVQAHQHYLRHRVADDAGRVTGSVGRTVALTVPKVEVER